MKMVEHTLALRGEACHGRRARPEVVGTVLVYVKPMIQDTVRMSFLRSSRTKGRPLSELRAAWDVQFLGQTGGPGDCTLLQFEAPSLGTAAPRLFEQGILWDEGLDQGDTAFDLMGHMIADVANRRVDSDRYDTPLLNRVARFHRAFERGLEAIEVSGHRLPSEAPPIIDHSVIESARSLAAETPAPKRVRVQGTLDMIRVSDHAFELILKDSNRVQAVWIGNKVVQLRELLNQPVVIEGDAVFRPSGRLLRVDTQAIDAASERDAFFSALPEPGGRATRRSEHLQRQTRRSGFNGIFGQWPGDETQDELLAALEELS